MTSAARAFALVLFFCAAAATALAQDGPMKVTYDEHNIIHVNGKPFLPLGIWLQPEDTFAMWKDLGINLFMAEAHPRREGTLAEYVKACEEHKVYMSLGQGHRI